MTLRLMLLLYLLSIVSVDRVEDAIDYLSYVVFNFAVQLGTYRLDDR